MNIIAQCDGGLCNRINNLVNGIYLSQLLNRKLYVWWDLNQACYCPLNKLFSTGFATNHKEIWEEEFVYYSPFHTAKKQELNTHGEKKFRPLWRYDDYTTSHIRPVGALNRKCEEIKSELQNIKSKTLVFSSSVILTEIIPEEQVCGILSHLIPTQELLSKILSAIKSHSIDNSVIGIHLRRTDYDLLEDNYVIKTINAYLKLNASTKFLLCSDSRDTENKFKGLYPEIVICTPKEYIEKINERKSDRQFSNLMRTERSVQDALVDLYLLAQTSFKIFSPVSTFAQTAYRLSKRPKNLN